MSASIAPYLDGLARGELRITRCSACGAAQFPPRVVCPHCAATGATEWIVAGGRGRVWSRCVFHKAYLPPPAPQPPYVVAVVQLEEGAKIISALEPDDLPVGTQVEAAIDAEAGMVRFRAVATPGRPERRGSGP